MNPIFPPQAVPAAARLLRLRDGLAALPDFGPLYLQARGIGGGLGKAIRTFQPIFVEGLDFAFDPDAGAGFSIRDLSAIHAVKAGDGSYFSGSLEFEFDDWPQGLGLHLMPDEEGARRLTIGEFVASVPSTPLEEEALEVWRESRRKPAPMCPCCRERARHRARFPERHPLHAILHHALVHRLDLEVRLSAPHADLSATFSPGRIEVRDGYLVVSDAPALHALHLDMARLHALAIDTTRLDGCDYAFLRLFDPRGMATFQILCEDASLATLWREFCESAD